MNIDPTTIARAFKDRRDSETDPVVRRNLDVAYRHSKAELDGDLDAIMATMSPSPIYHFYNFVDGAGVPQASIVRGTAAVRAMYAAGIVAGSQQRQDLRDARMVADANCVAVEGVLRVALSGQSLIEAGYAADPAAKYLLAGRLCAFLPMSADGLLIGEDVYYDPSAFRGILDRKL